MNVKFIEQLRFAAAQHDAVAELLFAMSASVLLDGYGNAEIIGDAEDLSVLKDALIAAEFSIYDRENSDGQG